MTSSSQCINCEKGPRGDFLKGLFSSYRSPLDKTYTTAYDEKQSKNMSEAGVYKEYIGVYEEYRDKIYNYFYYRTAHDSHTAEDLTSDTFIKAYENFHTYDERYAMSTWIYTIARNTLTDHFRKEGRVTQLEIDEDHEDAQALSFLDLIDSHLDIERVLEHIGSLPEKQRLVICKKYFEYKDTSEIAEMEGMQESAVRKNISRGIQKLQELLAILVIFINTV